MLGPVFDQIMLILVFCSSDFLVTCVANIITGIIRMLRCGSTSGILSFRTLRFDQGHLSHGIFQSVSGFDFI